MKIVCPHCSTALEIDDDTPMGQHIRCGVCRSKFAYLTESEEFSSERLAYAIAECRKDPDENRYYSAAPAGARLYIGLIFYGKVFKDTVNVDRYMAALTEIEPNLKSRDWQYLLEHEGNPELAIYFQGKLNEPLGATFRVIPEKRGPIEKPRLGIIHPTVKQPERRIETAAGKEHAVDRSRHVAKINHPTYERRHSFVGRIAAAAICAATALVGIILVQFSHKPVVAADKTIRHLTPPPEDGCLVRAQDQLYSVITNNIEHLHDRRGQLKKSIVEIRDDRHRLDADLDRIIEKGNMKAAEAQTKGLLRLNGAETAMLVLMSQTFNELAGRYMKEKPFMRADACRERVQSELSKINVAAPSVLDGIDMQAVSLQENGVGELRRCMDEMIRSLSALSREIAETSAELGRDRYSVNGMNETEITRKMEELKRMTGEAVFVKSCVLSPLGTVTSPLRDADVFSIPKVIEPSVRTPIAVSAENSDVNSQENEPLPDANASIAEAVDRKGNVKMLQPPPMTSCQVVKSEESKQEKLIPSDMSLALFKSGRVKEPSVFRVKVAVAARNRSFYDESEPHPDELDKYWRVRIRPDRSAGDDENSKLLCFVPKISPVGKRVCELLKDGAYHSAMVKIRYEDFCIMDAIEVAAAIPSDVLCKFSSTRISVTKGEQFDYLQGKIVVGFRSSQKYIKKPVLRIVVLMDENGSRVVRDCILDEPNVKMLNENGDEWWRDYWRKHTTTWGNDDNEPEGERCTVEELSTRQNEVSAERYKSVAYEGVPLGEVERKGVKGRWTAHMFGYSKFDVDEKAKLLGYRIEAWQGGTCIGQFDSIRKSQVKRLQIPDDWYIAFQHPEKFKYRPPFSTKQVVRR